LLAVSAFSGTPQQVTAVRRRENGFNMFNSTVIAENMEDVGLTINDLTPQAQARVLQRLGAADVAQLEERFRLKLSFTNNVIDIDYCRDQENLLDKAIVDSADATHQTVRGNAVETWLSKLIKKNICKGKSKTFVFSGQALKVVDSKNIYSEQLDAALVTLPKSVTADQKSLAIQHIGHVLAVLEAKRYAQVRDITKSQKKFSFFNEHHFCAVITAGVGNFNQRDYSSWETTTGWMFRNEAVAGTPFFFSLVIFWPDPISYTTLGLFVVPCMPTNWGRTVPEDYGRVLLSLSSPIVKKFCEKLPLQIPADAKLLGASTPERNGQIVCVLLCILTLLLEGDSDLLGYCSKMKWYTMPA
jgi:hypothetical protein